MKKTFNINSNPNKKPARQVDAIKHEINKYLSRERRKDLPEGVDYWDFDCQLGVSSDDTQEVHVSKINSAIDSLLSGGIEEFYVQIKAKACRRNSKRS